MMSSSNDDDNNFAIPPSKKAKIERMANMETIQYPSMSSIMEYIDPNRRIRLYWHFPSLRSIESSVPLRIDRLEMYPTRIFINHRGYMWDNFNLDEAVEALFKHRTSPTYVYYMHSFPFKNVNLCSKFRPTKLGLFGSPGSEVMLDTNPEIFCTKNLKELEFTIKKSSESILKLPVLNQLQYLYLVFGTENPRDYIDQLTNLAIPRASICFQDKSHPPFEEIFVLEYWISKKIPHKKLSVRVPSNPESIIWRLSDTVDLRKEKFQNNCWRVHNEDSEANSKVMITIDDEAPGFLGFLISVQVVPKETSHVRDTKFAEFLTWSFPRL